MRDDASAFEKSKAGSGQQHGVRSSKLRKTRLRALALEPLEARTLMSTLPPVTTASRTAISTATTGNSDAPSIAIDPNDPLKMVAVWVRNDPSNPKGPGSTTPTTAFVEAAYSTKGGVTGSWNPVPAGSLGNRTGPTYPLVTDASVAFDAHDNFFITRLRRRPARPGAVPLRQHRDHADAHRRGRHSVDGGDRGGVQAGPRGRRQPVVLHRPE